MLCPRSNIGCVPEVDLWHAFFICLLRLHGDLKLLLYCWCRPPAEVTPMHRRHISLLIVATLLLIGSVHAQEPRVAPANDYFSNRRVLSAREVMNASLTIGSAQDATTQSGEPMPSCGAASDTVWFEINAPYQIDLVVDTFESSLNSGASNNTVIAVYRSVFPTPALGSCWNTTVRAAEAAQDPSHGFRLRPASPTYRSGHRSALVRQVPTKSTSGRAINCWQTRTLATL